jgi:hypothetical protein
LRCVRRGKLERRLSNWTGIDRDGLGNGVDSREVDLDDQEAERRKSASPA